jgi:hypothetical protein
MALVEAVPTLPRASANWVRLPTDGFGPNLQVGVLPRAAGPGARVRSLVQPIEHTEPVLRAAGVALPPTPASPIAGSRKY